MTALAAGLEYTFSNISNSGLDIGVIGEYLYDDRGNMSLTGLDNDVFIGSRFAFNDVQSTEILAGFINDIEKGSLLFSIEAARRFGDSWKSNLEVRAFSNIDDKEFLSFIKKDSFIQFTLFYFFHNINDFDKQDLNDFY